MSSLHIHLEKKYQLPIDSLKGAEEELQQLQAIGKNHDEIMEVVRGCVYYCEQYGTDFKVTLSLYNACLMNPKKEQEMK